MKDVDFQTEFQVLVVGGLSKSEEQLENLADSFEPTTQSIRLLADTCRIPEWRQPLGAAGFLEAVLDHDSLTELAHNDQDRAFEALRYICNSVADTNFNRQIVLPHILDIFTAAETDKLRVAALSAILNLCQDYEPGLKTLLRVVPNIIARFASYIKAPDRGAIPTIISIVALIIPIHPPDEHASSYGEFMFQSILAITNAPGATTSQDEFLTCLDALMPILQVEEIQAILAKDISGCLNLLENCIIRLTGRKRLCSTGLPSIQKLEINRQHDEEEAEVDDIELEIGELSSHADALVGILAAASFHMNFVDANELLASEEVQDMIRWLSEEWKSGNLDTMGKDGEHIRFARAGALVLGNIATQEWIVNTLVKTNQVVPAAVDAISGSEDRELLSAAAGLLHNLAIPSTSKPVMQKAGAFRSAAKLLSMKRDGKPDVEVCIAGLKLLRVLLLDSLGNCTSFLVGEDTDAQVSLVNLLQNKYLTDARVMTEAGRALVALHRSLRASIIDRETVPILQILESVTAISSLISHPDPRNKSQGWMGLALISRDGQGAKEVYKCLTTSKTGIVDSFKVLLMQKESADQPLLEKDKENALVLLANLMQYLSYVMPLDELDQLKRLMSEYGKLRPP